MARQRREIRDGKLFCPGHGDWALVDSFRVKTQRGHGATPTYEPLCKLCEQTDRVDAQHASPVIAARAAIESRAGALARDLRNAGLSGFGRHQVLCSDVKGCDHCLGQQLNWELLIPFVSGMLEETCPSCGTSFGGRHDVQLDHIHAWRTITDLPLHHARNLRILCGSCNNSKKHQDDEGWVRGEWEKQGALYNRIHDERSAHCLWGCVPPARCLMCG